MRKINGLIISLLALVSIGHTEVLSFGDDFESGDPSS
jgi:hypothetical protein